MPKTACAAYFLSEIGGQYSHLYSLFPSINLAKHFPFLAGFQTDCGVLFRMGRCTLFASVEALNKALDFTNFCKINTAGLVQV